MSHADTTAAGSKAKNPETNPADAPRGIADAVAAAVEDDGKAKSAKGPDASAVSVDTKTAEQDTAKAAQPAETGATKRGPGRPRKSAAAKASAKSTAKTSAKSVKTKRGPGRPRKSATTRTASDSKTTKTTPNTSKSRKETTMATASKTDTNTTAAMTEDMQGRMQDAYAKATDFASEAGEFSTANIEAMVESGKLFFDGAQDMMRDNVEAGKTAAETMAKDAKAMASVKSPTEFMQLQREITQRNFDAAISYGSQRTEAWVKLCNEAFAPISNRVSVASEKMSNAA